MAVLSRFGLLLIFLGIQLAPPVSNHGKEKWHEVKVIRAKVPEKYPILNIAFSEIKTNR